MKSRTLTKSHTRDLYHVEDRPGQRGQGVTWTMETRKDLDPLGKERPGLR